MGGLDPLLICKVLRFLLKRFAIKVTTIEEVKDTTTRKLDKLIDSLQTFEMNMEEAKCDKIDLLKNVAFNA